MRKNFGIISVICSAFVLCGLTSCEVQQTSGQLSYAQTQTDMAITQIIGDYLANNSDLSGNARNISVSTYNGFVTLRGTTATSAERDRILRKVTGVYGVKAINNQLNTVSKN